MMFALTDFLVVLGCGLGIWRLWPHRRKGDVRMVRLGLAFIGLAALVGVVRFATGQVEGLAQWHSLASTFAGAAGMLLIALGVAWEAFPIRLPSGVGRYLRIGIPVLILGMMAWPGSADLLALLPKLALLLGLAASIALLVHRRWQTGLLWLFAWLLLGFASVVIGGSREETTFGIANWHIYHTLLAFWTVLAGEGIRRVIASRA
ncbi:hypothetical protein [uncultured Maricaulis sp.]|uniref:hypothetical protein n=1 Tax=uncultured Maricaulis sp. TaxID=174710 RepID=UPI0030DB59D4|tara:strand:- start:35125 stop:35739 length:615 start_codon:yes stop_codon:yes gene_type:complete